MISLDKQGGKQDVNSASFKGLSTDTKPLDSATSDIPNGSSFFEMDTFNVYFFDKANNQWITS